jgi:hypothetical protein
VLMLREVRLFRFLDLMRMTCFVQGGVDAR